MQRILYIDSIFFMNVIMDVSLLYLTAKTLRKTTTFFKILAGSLMGAAGYCLILCLPGSYRIKVMAGAVPAAALMLRIGCGIHKGKELLYGMGYLFTYSFLEGGFMLFLMHVFPDWGKNRVSLSAVLCTGSLSFGAMLLGIRKYTKDKQNHFCIVRLPGDEGEIRISGLIDTGNGLTDPVSGKRAAILEKQVWQKMRSCQRAERYKVIPFHSIGREKGILEGYEIDKIQIEKETGEKELEHVIITVFKGKLSAKGDYQMILPPEWF